MSTTRAIHLTKELDKRAVSKLIIAKRSKFPSFKPCFHISNIPKFCINSYPKPLRTYRIIG